MVDLDQQIKSILERMVETFVMLNMPNMAAGVLVLKVTIWTMDSDAYNSAERVSDLETKVSDLEETIFDLEMDIVRLEAEVSNAK